MAAVTPYARYSTYQHTTASDLISQRSEILQTLFPVGCYDEYNGPKISAFFITTSTGSKTLILGDALSFVNLRNSCDTLREILPVIFDCCYRNCSIELLQAIRDQGYTAGGSPLLIALQIESDTRNCLSKMLFPSYQGDNPQEILIRVIREEVQEGYIGNYCVRKVQESWVPPAGNPVWQGLAFEQDDRLIRTWIHEANPNALGRAREDAQRRIDQTVEARMTKYAEVARLIMYNRYQGQVKERKDTELADIQSTLEENQRHLTFLTAQTVNSSAHTTLQCAIRIEVDVEEKIQLLERYVCQQIVSVIDRALERVSWQALQIQTRAIEDFIRQKLNALEQKLPVLIENNDVINLTDWEDFRDDVFPEKRAWLRQTFQDFCQEKVGSPEPTPEERPELERAWKEGLSEKLKWITAQLRNADEQLKVIERFSFTPIDIRIFDTHRERMVRILRQGEVMTYALGLELDERYEERNLIRNAVRNHEWVHLVKRITTGGFVYFGVTQPPVNPRDRPDPNDCLNEVHEPIQYLKDFLRQKL